MDIELKERFITLWKKYFGEADLALTFYYTEGDAGADWAEKPDGWRCLVCQPGKVRKGSSAVQSSIIPTSKANPNGKEPLSGCLILPYGPVSGKMNFHLPYPLKDL